MGNQNATIRNRPLTALLTLTLFLAAAPVSHAHGPLKSLREWTNDLGERIFGFESNCPKSHIPVERLATEFQSACHDDALPSYTGNIRDIGVSVEQAEEWIWLKEAMSERIDTMSANYDHLDHFKLALDQGSASAYSTPEIRSEIERLKDHFRVLAGIKKRRSEISHDSLMTSLFPDVLGLHRAQNLAHLEDLRKKDKALEAAEGAVLEEEPLLAYPGLKSWLKKYAKADHFDVNDPGLSKAFSDSATEVEKAIQERIDHYSGLMQNETRLGVALAAAKTGTPQFSDLDDRYKDNLYDAERDEGMIQELLVSTDPSEKPGLAKLMYAGCRLQNRIFKNEGMGELRGFTFNAALTAATLGTGAFLAAGKGLTVAALAARAAPNLAIDALFVAGDAVAIHDKRTECSRLQAAAFSGVSKSASAGPMGAVTSYLSCQSELRTQEIMAAVTAGGMGAGETISILSKYRQLKPAIAHAAEELEAAKAAKAAKALEAFNAAKAVSGSLIARKGIQEADAIVLTVEQANVLKVAAEKLGIAISDSNKMGKILEQVYEPLAAKAFAEGASASTRMAASAQMGRFALEAEALITTLPRVEARATRYALADATLALEEWRPQEFTEAAEHVLTKGTIHSVGLEDYRAYVKGYIDKAAPYSTHPFASQLLTLGDIRDLASHNRWPLELAPHDMRHVHFAAGHPEAAAAYFKAARSTDNLRFAMLGAMYEGVDTVQFSFERKLCQYMAQTRKMSLEDAMLYLGEVPHSELEKIAAKAGIASDMNDVVRSLKNWAPHTAAGYSALGRSGQGLDRDVDKMVDDLSNFRASPEDARYSHYSQAPDGALHDDDGSIHFRTF